MNLLLRPRIWLSFSPSCRLYEPEAWRSRVSAPATYHPGTETNTLRLPGGTPILFAVAALRSVPQAGSQFHGLATAIHETSGLYGTKVFRSNVRKPHLALSYQGKAKQSQFKARMKQVMYMIQKQIPCQNLEYFILGTINMKNSVILTT